MILVAVSSLPEEIYLKILFEFENNPDSAVKLFEYYGDSLPDSLKLKLVSRLGYDLQTFLEDRVSRGSRDPKIWKTYLYMNIILRKMPAKKLKGFIKAGWDKFKDIPEVLNFVGEIYENYGMYEEASKAYKEALKLGSKMAAKNLAIIFAKMGRCDSSLKLFKISPLESIRDTYEIRRVYLSLGICYERKNHGEQALKYYQKAYEIQKDTLLGFKIAYLIARENGDDALIFLANMYDELGFSRPNLYWGYALIMSRSKEKVKEGIREVGEFMALRGDDAMARNILTHAFLRLGDTLTALKHAKRAFELAPKDEDYRLAYLMILSSVKNNPRKFGYLLRERDKENPVGKLIFARFYRKLGNGYLATKYYRELTEIDSTNVDLIMEAYTYFKSRRDYKNAYGTIRRLTKVYPDSLGFWFELGDVFLRMRKADSIYSVYYNLVYKYGFKFNDCELASILNNWAYTMALLNYKLDTAKILIDKAYRICKAEYILDSKGWIYFMLGKVNEGKKLVKRAVENYTETNRIDPEVLLHLSIILCVSENSQRAKETLRETWKYIDRDYKDFYKGYIKMCR